MKKFKILLVSLLMFAFATPFVVSAEEEVVTSSNGAEEREKINVYIFRGEGCGFCATALSFFESIEAEYGMYYNLVDYEVWNNTANAALMNELAEYLNTEINGVPFIMIGEETFPGFQESWGEEIKQLIVEEYNKSDEDRTDLMKNFENGVVNKDDSADAVITVVSVIVIAGIIAFVVYARKSNDSKKEKFLDEINDDDFESEDDYVEEVKVKTSNKKAEIKNNDENVVKKVAEKKATKKTTTSKSKATTAKKKTSTKK